MDKGDTKMVVVAIGIVLMAVIGLWVFMSSMEAKAYNRATGSNISTWDAMWIELRVQAGPK